jgi:hypothetical protein
MSYTVHVNHLGYELGAPKRAVVGTAATLGPHFRLLREPWRMPVWQGEIGTPGPVARWKRGEVQYARCDFSGFDEPGLYRLAVGDVVSEPFAIQPGLLWSATAEAVLRYFRGQRCRGAYDEADRRTAFFGDARERVDVHGGWYDASGDLSKYLSHLSYANFMNPQQTPMVVYSLLASADLVPEDALAATMRQEAAYGGDFLVRMQDPAGYFYVTIFDRWSKKLDERLICAFRTQKGDRLPDYKAGYRQGAGVAIAALARLAASEIRGEFPCARYLEVAERGFAHLEAHNAAYLPDGRENIIDDYCALLAATELFIATSDARYHAAAERRAGNLIGRLTRHPGFGAFWRADDGARPFFHAAEAGLPVVALLRWAEHGSAQPDRLLAAVRESLLGEIAITEEVANPFGYARQYVQSPGGTPRASFFHPHENESGYWWQGENARLASLAAAAALALPRVPLGAAEQCALRRYAQDQLDWILGKNPFDSCMIFGLGRGSADYLEAWPNYPGGVCNGITSGFHDEEDIDFLPAAWANDILQNWRWSEQWLPHGAWFLYAIAALRAASRDAGLWLREAGPQRHAEPSPARVESPSS